MTEIVRTVADLRSRTRAWRQDGHSSAVVPTMGALHEGHLALVRAALGRAARTVVTIFVNPQQFGPHEDLARYPRDEAGDLARLEAAGVDVVFAPGLEEMYRPDFATAVVVSGPAKAGLEDKFRPHFFMGVATVVAKLFNQSGCDHALFGEKDYQQLRVVTVLARDLDIPIEVIGLPTVREPDGLALSSRNRYLSAPERRKASALHRALDDAAEKVRAGVPPMRATAAASRSLTTQGFKVDYIAARHARTLARVDAQDAPMRVLGAAWLGPTRLIDNSAV